ncbi:MAG: DUF4199 domain-containing protein [Bacteroidales bacterium]|nr:DUF4199 domain-containing protein [Bacteroidales bacterium]
MDNKQSLTQYAMSNGLILGIILIILSLVAYIMNIMPESFGKIILIPLINSLIVVVFVVKGTKSYRNKVLDGTISFWNAFLVGLLIVVFAYILKSFYDLIFNGLIDKEYMNRFFETIQNWAYNLYSNLGLPENDIEDAMSQFERQQENYTPIRAFFVSIFSSTILGTVLSLITAAIFKKEPPPFGLDGRVG